MRRFKKTKIYKAVNKELFFSCFNLLEKISFFSLIVFISLYIYQVIKNIDTGSLFSFIVIDFVILLISHNLNCFFKDFVKNPQNKLSLKEAFDQGYNLFPFLNFKSVKSFKKVFSIIPKDTYPDPTTILKCFLDNKNPKIIFIFSRLLIDYKEIKKGIKNIQPIENSSKEFEEILKEAGAIALRRNGSIIKEGDIVASLAKFEPILKKIITESEIKEEDFENINEWQERVSFNIKKRKEWWSYENLLKLGSIGRDWTAGFTPTLDSFSIDWTNIVQRRGFEEIIGHKDKIDQLERILSKKNGGNALIIGDPGVGRKNIIHGLIRRSLINQSVKGINGYRFIELDIVSLSSSIASYEHMENILAQCFEEVIHARNVILIINDFHDFLGGKQKAGIVDISGIIGNYLASPNFKTICLTSYKGLHQYIENKPAILGQFQKIEVEEMNREETLKVIETKVFQLEAENEKFIPFTSLKEVIDVCEKYSFNLPFPQKAINLLEEASVSKSGTIILPEDIDRIFSEKTSIPVGKMHTKEKETLLNMEEILHQRIIGQKEAIKEISSALRRARSGIKTKKGPMGSFLFLGPTGVGKTETAKALAETYFGSEEKIIRIDMSEFQNIEDLWRLIGSNEQEGILTTKVRENPFSLVLLDEIEKSHPNILNIFLQILDEGYVNDHTGRKVSFINTIVIATSNAGYEIILKAIKDNREMTELKKELLSKIFSEGTFRPEFINRFDGVIVFKSLNKEELKSIARLQLNKINKKLSKNKIKLVITDELEDKIVELSYNPTFGAREINRTIQDKVENALAREMLESSIPNGSSIIIDSKNFKVSII